MIEQEKLSVRAYNLKLQSHSHAYYQLVIPMHGVIELCINQQVSLVGIGQCAIIPRNTNHSFKAREQARFLVADLNERPENMLLPKQFFLSISDSLLAFCNFCAAQLEYRLNADLEASMLSLFKQLLAEQTFQSKVDQRIVRVCEFMEMNLAEEHSLVLLASKAHLSLSQFKALFKQQTGKAPRQYLLMLRMEKARALLANTDFPAQQVAEQVGYHNHSAFSRRFNAYFGQTPSSLTKAGT